MHWLIYSYIMWLNQSFQIHGLSWMFICIFKVFKPLFHMMSRQGAQQLNCIPAFPDLEHAWPSHYSPRRDKKSTQRPWLPEETIHFSPTELKDEQNEKSASENHKILRSLTLCSCRWLHQPAQTYPKLRNSSPLVNMQNTKYCYSSWSG